NRARTLDTFGGVDRIDGPTARYGRHQDRATDAPASVRLGCAIERGCAELGPGRGYAHRSGQLRSVQRQHVFDAALPPPPVAMADRCPPEPWRDRGTPPRYPVLLHRAVRISTRVAQQVPVRIPRSAVRPPGPTGEPNR